MEHPRQPAQQTWFSSLLRTRTLVAVLVCATLASLVAVYFIFTHQAERLKTDSRSVITLIVINLALFLVLGAIVVRRAVRLWASLKEGSVGSRMQTRIVVMFTLVTIIPTIIVSVFSTLFFDLGIQSWFDERVSTALDESVAVAQAYLEEHRDNIRGDVIAMANDVDRELGQGLLDRERLNSLIDAQVKVRLLSEAVVLLKGKIIGQSQLTFSLAFEQLAAGTFERADRGEVVVTMEGLDKVRGLIRLKSIPDTYLLVGRFVDAKVVSHVESAEGGVKEYRRLKENISGLQLEFVVVFVLLALLLLFAAVWYGMLFAARLIVPITNLVGATERVRGGDFSARVIEGAKDDEIGVLARAFNRMTDELNKQRTDLIEANRQSDVRRRMFETVLAGVSAGVISLSRDKRVVVVNPVAPELLLLPPEALLKDRSIVELVPEFGPLLTQAEERPSLQAQEDITIIRQDKSHVLHVRVAVERGQDSIEGYIITFDDITQLLVAQRSAAWADVARRVAHEIKNPLTPIQLSAERLRKKFMPAPTEDAESYTRYLDTIVRHVGDIGKIVEEFAAFARMPAPHMKREDMVSILRKAVFSEQTTHADITYVTQAPPQPVYVQCDEQQIRRLLLNTLKNAAEAFETVPAEAPRQIEISCVREQNLCRIRIHDNGPGFPPDKINRLFEPYVTTRAKGTGLGLAIAKKICDDHKAQLTLENPANGGACVTMYFSIDSDINVT